MIHRTFLPPRISIPKQEIKQDEFITTFENKIVIEAAKQVDNLLLEELYKIYKNKADEVIVIDETEFEEFIRKYLPIYIQEKNNDR